MYKLLILVILNLSIIVSYAQNDLVNVEESLFEMAKDAIHKKEYKQAYSLLIAARDNGYCIDSIMKYERLIDFQNLNNTRLKEALKLYDKKRFQDAKEVFDSLPNDYLLDTMSIKARNICNERVKDINEGRAVSRELAQLMNDNKNYIKINPYISKSFNGGYFKCKINNSTYFISKNGFAIPGVKARECFDDSTFIISNTLEPERLCKILCDFDQDDNKIVLPSAVKYVPFLNFEFDHIWPQVNGFAKIRDNGRFGYINLRDNIIIKCIYDNVGDFSDGLIRVSNGKRWGYIDSLGNQVIDFKFKYCKDFSEGLAVAEKGKKCGYIDKKGNWVIEPQFDGAWNFKNGYAAVRIKDKWFFINREGRNIFNQYFPEIRRSGDIGFSEGYACVRLFFENNGQTVESKWGFIDTKGNRLTPFIYDEAENFSDGVAVVARDGYKYGYIDKTGKEIIEPIYEEAFDFKENLGLIRLDGFYGFIDKNGVTTFNFNINEDE